MTKIISSPNIDFGLVDEFKSSVANSKVTNTGTERVTLTDLISSDERFVLNSFDTRIEPKMPANSTLYFGANGRIQSATGAYYTTDQGFGAIGTTDADSKLTINHLMPSLALTSPSAGTKYKLSESFNVTWTSSNITLVNVILESESGGYKKYSDVAASLGTLAVSILASDGFSINETVYIYIENTHQTVEDSVQVQSIATLTMTTPVLTAGTEGTITGTHNGGTGYFVQVQYRVASPEGAWTTFENNVTVEAEGTWEATGTVALAETYDFRARDTVDPDGQIQLDDVVVESSESTENLFVTCLLSTPENHFLQKRLKSDLSYVSKIGSKGSGNDQFSNPRGIAVDDTYIYIVEYGNHRIQKRLKSDLSYVSKIGSHGSGDDQFKYPYAIAVDDTYIYIADTSNHRIQKRLKSDLSYVSKIGSRGSGNDQFEYPNSIAVDDTYIYITERDNNRIQKRLKSDLSYVSKIGSSVDGDDQFDTLYGIAVEPNDWD